MWCLAPHREVSELGIPWCCQTATNAQLPGWELPISQGVMAWLKPRLESLDVGKDVKLYEDGRQYSVHGYSLSGVVCALRSPAQAPLWFALYKAYRPDALPYDPGGIERDELYAWLEDPARLEAEWALHLLQQP